jgi:hypothetical protein
MLLLCGSLTWSFFALQGLSTPGAKTGKAPGRHAKGHPRAGKPHVPSRWERIARAFAIPWTHSEERRPAARRGGSAKAVRRVRIPSDRGAVAVEKRIVLGVGAHVVTVNTASPAVRMTVALAAGGIGRGEPWPRMIDRLRPTAAITGTYFNTATLVPVGSLVAGVCFTWEPWARRS